MILISRYLVPKGYTGISLYPFMFLKHKEFKDNKVIVNHEQIHLKQQLELLVLPFYIWYALEFCWRLCKYKRWHAAYAHISFEREAYANEKDVDYIKTRPRFSFLKYIN